MKALFLRSAAILLILSVAGCSTVERVTGRRTGVDVTRSHLGQPIARGSIAIESFDQAGDNVAEFQNYRTAVARQLTRLGWTLAGPDGQSEQVALIDVQQGSPAAIRGRIGTAGGVGLGGTSPELVATLLEVRIKRRSDGTIFWDGRATTETRANTAEAQRTAAVEKLAEALFRDFPGESGRTIRVR